MSGETLGGGSSEHESSTGQPASAALKNKAGVVANFLVEACVGEDCDNDESQLRSKEAIIRSIGAEAVGNVKNILNAESPEAAKAAAQRARATAQRLRRELDDDSAWNDSETFKRAGLLDLSDDAVVALWKFFNLLKNNEDDKTKEIFGAAQLSAEQIAHDLANSEDGFARIAVGGKNYKMRIIAKKPDDNSAVKLTPLSQLKGGDSDVRLDSALDSGKTTFSMNNGLMESMKFGAMVSNNNGPDSLLNAKRRENNESDTTYLNTFKQSLENPDERDKSNANTLYRDYFGGNDESHRFSPDPLSYWFDGGSQQYFYGKWGSENDKRPASITYLYTAYNMWRLHRAEGPAWAEDTDTDLEILPESNSDKTVPKPPSKPPEASESDSSEISPEAAELKEKLLDEKNLERVRIQYNKVARARSQKNDEIHEIHETEFMQAAEAKMGEWEKDGTLSRCADKQKKYGYEYRLIALYDSGGVQFSLIPESV